MHMSRFVVGAAVVAIVGPCAAGPAAAQAPPTPRLDRQQQTTLSAVVQAVDQARVNPALVSPSEWQSHLLRASDGSHYVALRGRASGLIAGKDPVMLYVRLESRREPNATTSLQRSAVMEWLNGERADPLPMRARGTMNVPAGEMPVGGAASILGSRPDLGLESTAQLRLMERDRLRVIREREEREARRKAELENAARSGTPAMHPFEDFEPDARLDVDARGTTVLRSVRAGPGDYVLSVAWAEPAGGNRPPVVRVLTHAVSLPAASSDFSLSDIVLADSVRTLDAAYPTDRQNAHPYAIGALEASPAGDAAFRVDERLSILFQVINPSAAEAGKPDVEVTFAFTRLVGEREEVVGSLPAQRHAAATLPVDFDVNKGHPLFAAVQASLATFRRGHYRLTVSALDQVNGRRATRSAAFEVVGTPHSLLNEAPSPGQAFRREALLTPAMLGVVAKGLTPATPSEGLTRALDAATAGRFSDLVKEAPVTSDERAIAQALRGVGLFALGDSPRTVAAQLQQALAQGAPAGPVLLILGATYAQGGDDKGAVAAWNQARDGSVDDAAVATLMVDAYIRQGDVARATAMARAALDAQPTSPSAVRGLAAARIAAGQYADALSTLDGLAGSTSDPDTDFLVVHALYGGFVGGTAPGATPTGRDRLLTVGRRYVDAGGGHAALVTEWLAVVTAQPPPAP
jgi:tetratricopeptide (TPR) repeat protein